MDIGNKLKELGIPSVAKSYFEYGLLENPDDFSLEAESEPVSTKTPEKTENQHIENSQETFEIKEPVQNQGEYSPIRTLNELSSLVDLAIEKKLVAFDTETDNLNPLEANLAGFSLIT